MTLNVKAILGVGSCVGGSTTSGLGGGVLGLGSGWLDEGAAQ